MLAGGTKCEVSGGSAGAVLVPMTVGVQGDGFAQLVDGLAAGDVVIVHPDRALSDGDRVQLR